MSFQDLESGRAVGLRNNRSLINGKQDPTQAVVSGIFQITTAVGTFQRLVNTLGTPKDTPELREKLRKTRLHIAQLVKDTSAKLKQASETDHRSQVSASKKITDAKLAKEFEAVLKEFQKAQRLAAEREIAYTPFVPQSSHPPSEVDDTSEKHPEQRALLVESRSYAMKVQGFQVWICWTVHILWFYLVVSSSSSEIRVEKYITSLYFDRHGCLIDSDFDDFVRQELKALPCQLSDDSPNDVSKLIDLNRSLIGEGSHRQLATTVRFHLGLIPTHQLHACSWEVIMVERLPSGIFADPFEVQHLVHRGVFSDAAVFGDTNLELPSFRSNRSLIEVHKKIEPIKTDKLEAEININLPLHARYQPLGHEFSKVILGKSDLFIRCSYKADINKTCLISTNINPSVKDTMAVWEVPCGSKEHAKVVSAVTFISAAISAFLIVYTSIKFSGATVSNDLKLS